MNDENSRDATKRQQPEKDGKVSRLIKEANKVAEANRIASERLAAELEKENSKKEK